LRIIQVTKLILKIAKFFKMSREFISIAFLKGKKGGQAIVLGEKFILRKKNA